MKNYLKLGFATIALMFTFNIFATAQGPVNEILKRMDEHYKSLTSLKSNIMMDKYNAQLDEHDVTEGTVMYLPAKGRDATVRIDWAKPRVEILAVINKQYVLYQPSLKRAIIGKVNDAQKDTKSSGLLDFMSMSREQLRDNYTIKFLGQETMAGGFDAWHLELTPKTPKSYKSSEIWVDGNGMPIQTKIIEKNNDSTTVLLSNLQKNITINGSVFKPTLPKDTNIVKN
jgi:outer membrane lipoprotein-sorting protein